jgi:hypothetical protein
MTALLVYNLGYFVINNLFCALWRNVTKFRTVHQSQGSKFTTLALSAHLAQFSKIYSTALILEGIKLHNLLFCVSI